MPRLAIGDGEIAYEESGSGHPLLFVSGLNGTGRSWAPQVPVFSRHYRVITYDQRGTGSSDRLQRSFSVDGMAADVIALLHSGSSASTWSGSPRAARSARHLRYCIPSGCRG
jgi:pimeloyl-ACP methyl ester carboxylesterase